MKKRYLVMTILAILILVTVSALGIYKMLEKQGKEYEIEQVKQYNFFVLKQNNQYGVIDKQGNVLIEPQYSEIKLPNPEKAVFVCYQGEETKVLNEKKEEILKEYSHVEPIRLKNISSDLMYEKSILKYEKEGKYGVITFTGKEIVKPIYDEIDSLPYKEGELLVRKEEKFGVVNLKGSKLVEVQYDEIKIDEYYTEEDQHKYAGYIVSNKTQEGYRYGYSNYKGEKILETEYNEISRIKDRQDSENCYLICAKNGQYGVVKNKEDILKHEYQSVSYEESNQIFMIEKSRKYGVANLKGEIVIPIQYDEINITGIYLYAKNEQGITVYDKEGKQIDMEPNIAILDTSNEKYKIKINNENGTKYGVINQEGDQLIEEKYNYIEYLYDNYFIVSNENGKLGVVNDTGIMKIEPNNDVLQKMQDSKLIKAIVSQGNTMQIYDESIKKICEMQNAIVEVEKDYIKVYNDTETKYFSKQGKELNCMEIYTKNKLFVSQKNGQYGFIEKNGNVVVDYKYDKAYELNPYGFAAVKKSGKWGAINEKGEEVVAPIYTMKDTKEPIFIGKYYRVTYGVGEFYYTDNRD